MSEIDTTARESFDGRRATRDMDDRTIPAITLRRSRVGRFSPLRVPTRPDVVAE
jgi:hypothetical protein